MARRAPQADLPRVDDGQRAGEVFAAQNSQGVKRAGIDFGGGHRVWSSLDENPGVETEWVREEVGKSEVARHKGEAMTHRIAEDLWARRATKPHVTNVEGIEPGSPQELGERPREVFVGQEGHGYAMARTSSDEMACAA